IICTSFHLKSSEGKKKLSFVQQRLEREQNKQRLKRFFCEETDLPNINYIQEKLLRTNRSTYKIMHVICVGRSADFYKFFDSKTSRIVKTELHHYLSETLSPRVIGLFEDKYIVLVFESDTPW
ncbi:hypothetical protein AB4567_19600, partial [Vibrio sp. 10N.222.51.A6]